MAISLSAEQKNISKIFLNDDLFIIPSYQRPYSWEYDECYQLYVDSTAAFERKEAYFLGNIILAKSLDASEMHKLKIIDGQQRCISLWLIIKSLSVLYPDISRLQRLIGIEAWNSDEAWTPRIVSQIIEDEDNDDLGEVFKWNKDKFDLELAKVTNRDGNINEKKTDGRIQTNCLYFYQWFSRLQDKNAEYLKEFVRYFIESITLLPIELNGNNIDESENQALSIFETINNRGRDLEDADIFKAKLYSSSLIKVKQDAFMANWAMLKETARDLNQNIDDIFRYYSHIVRSEAGTVSNEIKLRKFFVDEPKSPLKLKTVDVILDDLFKITKSLKFYESEKNSPTQLAKWLQIIDAYTNMYPKYAIIVYLYYKGGEVECDDQHFIKFIQSLVRYVYSKGTTTTVKFEIYNIIVKIFRGDNINDYSDSTFVLDNFEKMGRLKKGFTLIAQYANTDSVAIPFYKLDRRISTKEAELDKDFANFDINSLGNLYIREEKEPKESILWSIDDFLSKEESIRRTIENFFTLNNI